MSESGKSKAESVPKTIGVETITAPQERLAIVNLTSLRAGSDVFKSSGYCYLKVTRGGIPHVLNLPIKSSGVAEVIEGYKDKEPKPPSHQVLVEPNTPVGRQLKLGTKQWVEMPNLNDPEYIKLFDRYQTDMAFAIILVGLDLPIEDERGTPLVDRDEKITALRGLGFSTEHFEAMVRSIRELTQLTEEDKISFFGRNSGSHSTIVG
jgi:hypothetical protein